MRPTGTPAMSTVKVSAASGRMSYVVPARVTDWLSRLATAEGVVMGGLIAHPEQGPKTTAAVAASPGMAVRRVSSTRSIGCAARLHARVRLCVGGATNQLRTPPPSAAAILVRSALLEA